MCLFKRFLFRSIGLSLFFGVVLSSCQVKAPISNHPISSADSSLFFEYIEQARSKVNLGKDSMFKAWGKAFYFAREKHFIYGQLRSMGSLLMMIKNYPNDTVLLKWSAQLIDSLHVLSSSGETEWKDYKYYTLTLKGRVLIDQNKFDSAQYYFRQSVAQSHHDSETYYSCIYSLAMLNFQSGHFVSSARYVQKVMRWNLKQRDTANFLRGMSMLPMCYASLGDTNNAFKYFNLLGQWIGNDTNRNLEYHATRLYNLASFYSRLEQNDSAIIYYKRCLNLLYQYPDRFPYPHEMTKLSLAKLLLNVGKLAEANKYFEEVKSEFELYGYPKDLNLLTSYYNVGYRINLEQQQYKKTLYYFDLEKHTNEQIQNEALTNQLLEHEKELKKLGAEKTIAQKDSQISKQKQINTLWGSLAAILSISTFGFYINLKQKQKFNRITLEKEVLNSKLQERDRIAQEMHDDLGSTLTSLMMAVEMYSAHPENEQNKTRIDLMSKELYHQINDVIWRINSGNDYVQNLCAHIYKFAKKFLTQANITFESSVDIPKELTAIQGMKRHLIYLTTKEIIHNIVKHAQARKVIINIQYVNQLLLIIIKDDGIGFNQHLMDQRLMGNGLSNIKKNLSKMNGNVQWHNINGTTVELSIPLTT